MTLISHTTAANPNFQRAVDALTLRLAQAGGGMQEARMQAYAMVYRAVPRSGLDAGLHRYLLGSRSWGVDDVLSVLSPEEQPPRWRRRNGSRLKLKPN